MPSFVVDFQGDVPEFGQIVLVADDAEQAKEFALERIEDAYPEMINVEINRIEEDLN